MRTALRNARIVTPAGIRHGSLIIDGSVIEGLCDAAQDLGPVAHSENLAGSLLLPGFIDPQVNGGGGVLFGDVPEVATLRTIAAAHRRFGTTALLATLISADLATIARAITAVDHAIAAGVPGIIGIHIEGPFLSQARKGIHDASHFLKLDTQAFSVLTSAKHARTLLTLAPEETTPDAIGALSAAGIIVSAGHSNAHAAQVRTALASGLSGFTHLFNAMSQMTAREPGVVGAALDDAQSWCSIIADGRHVDPAMLRIALKCKGYDKLVLATDAMPTVGSATKSFELYGQRIVVQNGVCVAQDGTLAGSDLDMASALRNIMAYLDLDIAQASPLASGNAAKFLRLGPDYGCIAPGCRADLVQLDDDLGVVRTWIGGQQHD